MRIIRYQTPSRRYYNPAATYKRSPWGGLEAEFNRLFNMAVSGAAKQSSRPQFSVDFYQDENNVYVRAELPGFAREAINVEVVDGNLTIEATREAKKESGQTEAKFNRSLELPHEVKADGVSAAYEAGILTVTLPKQAAVKPNKITVAVK
jgi:HSP20 family protein